MQSSSWLLASLCISCAATRDSLGTLPSQLLSGYDKSIMPVAVSDGITADFQLTSLKLLNFDESSSVAKIALKGNMMWQDNRLSWAKDEFDNLDHIRLGSESIWLPPLSRINDVDDLIEALGPDDGPVVIVQSSGHVNWNFRLSALTPCTRTDDDSKDFEKLVCELEYGSIGYPTNIINFNAPTNRSTLFEEGQKINTITGATLDSFDKLDCCPEANYSHISISIDLQKSKSHVQRFHGSIILPCIALSLLILLQFLIPPNIGERVVYAILVIIFFTAFAYIVSDLSLEFEVRDCWFFTMLYIFALALGAVTALTNTCLVVNFHHAKHNTAMHPLYKKVLIDWLPRVLFMHNAGKEVERKMSEKHRSTKRRSPNVNGDDPNAATAPLLTSGEDAATSSERSIELATLKYLNEIARELRDLSREVIFNAVESRGSPQWICAAETLNRLGIVTISLYIFICHFIAIIYYWTM